VEPTVQKQRLTDALKLVKNDDLTAAIASLRSLLDEAPRFSRGWIALGKLYRQLGERRQALQAFQSVEKIAPNHSTAAIEGALELKALGKLGAAVAKLERVLNRQPENPSALFNLGLLYEKKKQREKAIAAFSKTISVNPDHFWARLHLAIAYRYSGQTERAQPLLETLLKTHPENSQVYFECGLASRKKGDAKKAASFFEQAVVQSNQLTQTIKASLQLAVEQITLGELATAEETLTLVLEQSPDHLLALQTLAGLYQKQHKISQAIEVYQRAISSNPTHVPAYLQLSAIWRSQSDYLRAQQHLESALGVDPSHLNVLLNLSAVACDQRDYSRALAYCEQADIAHPDRVEPQLQKAEVLRLFHHFEKARSQLKQLLKNFPQNPRIHLKLGYIFRQMGKRQQALEQFEKMRTYALSSTQADSAQLLVVEELQSLNRFSEALAQIQQFSQQHPENIRAKLTIANVLKAQCNFTAAEEVYRDILAAFPHDVGTHLVLAKLLSDTSRTSAATALLEGFYQQGHREFPVLMQLGTLARAENDWVVARYWYQLAKKFHPFRPQVYGMLADAMYTCGDIEKAMALLSDAGNRLPNTPEVPLRLANLKLRYGLPFESLRILQSAHQQYPNDIFICLQLSRLMAQLGEYEQSNHLLALIDSDQVSFLKQIAQIRGEIAFAQFDLTSATDYFSASINLSPVSVAEYQRLALVLMLTGDVAAAYAYLTSAAKTYHDNNQSGQPLLGHVPFLINQMRLNPSLVGELQRSQTQPPLERLLTLGAVILKEPAYLGASAFLCKELKQQGIFDQLRACLPAARSAPLKAPGASSSTQLPTVATIPRKIIQYWDTPTLPLAALEVTRSWQAQNPDYEYELFDSEQATQFIQQHYDDSLVQAFKHCDQAATQADLFRLAYLNKMGGFYVDIDDRCLKSLDDFAYSNAELVVYQEENACIGNNFIGCIPHQTVICTALYQAVANLSCYNNEGPWMQTGPGLITTSFCSHLLPYLTSADYRSWPRFWVLSQEALRHYVSWGVSLPYKFTLRNWQKSAYDGPTQKTR